ncbi:MAG: ATP-dependent metallopeptidase FtsH/Yme1/Tma family protein, partial [Spirochaetaceae bacterium]|nr:ATP-dependent metallopeptidase FtsH/Yme1/Tma family protein [Spirochaetaceae bacterium]
MADDRNNKQQNPGPFGFKFKNNRFALILLVAIFGIFIVLLSSPGRTQGMEIDYSAFLNYVEQDQVESVT